MQAEVRITPLCLVLMCFFPAVQFSYAGASCVVPLLVFDTAVASQRPEFRAEFSERNRFSRRSWIFWFGRACATLHRVVGRCVTDAPLVIPVRCVSFLREHRSPDG